MTTPYGEDYDCREVLFLDSCGRSMENLVRVIKIDSMAEIGLPRAKPKPRSKQKPKGENKA